MGEKKKSRLDAAKEMAVGAAKDPVGAAKFARDMAVVTAKDAADKGKKVAGEAIEAASDTASQVIKKVKRS